MAVESGRGPGEGNGKVRVIGPGHGKWRKACINIFKYILKFSNCVLVRVPINNNNSEQPIELFDIILAKNTCTNHHGVGGPTRPANATCINKRLCQHTDESEMIQSTRAWLGRRHLHLQLPIVY